MSQGYDEQSWDRATQEKVRWDERPRFGDRRPPIDPTGKASGTGRERTVFLTGMAAIGINVGVVNALNVIGMVHMRPELGLAWPIVWEATAGLALLMAALIPWHVLKRVPLGRKPLWRTALVYLGYAPVFSVVHVAIFVTLRILIYRAAGFRYDFGPILSGFAYETSRNIFGYVGSLAAFSLAGAYFRRPAAVSVRERTFDIRDGQRLLRVPVRDILAISSAGNYVEFVLRDGRKPLMRAPLSNLEAQLSVDGFVRTHRSWLVNVMQVTGLKPEGSGDYEIELGAVTVPLSRRFPDALARLRVG
jgi:hypothetical protein